MIKRSLEFFKRCTISSGHGIGPKVTITSDQYLSWPALFPSYTHEYFLFSTGAAVGSPPSPYGAVYTGSVQGCLMWLNCIWKHGDYTGGYLALLQRPAL